jgi:hypothetical protein
MSERSFRRDRERRIAAEQRREATRARKAAAAAALTGAFVLAAPAVSSAATFTVNQTADGPIGTTTCAPDANTDPCNLRDAIAGADSASGADTIVFDSTITGQTITLNSGALYVDDNYPLTIYGGPTPGSIYVDGNAASMVFDIRGTYYNPPDPGLTLSGLTIQNGVDSPAGGMLVRNDGNVLLTNSTVTGNTAHGAQVDKYSFAAGGGITNEGQLEVTNSTISANAADVPNGNPYPVYGGGGIDNLNDLTVTHSTISGNGSRELGGGLFNGWTNYPASMKVSDTRITDNYSYEGGGVASSSFFGFNGYAVQGDIGSNRVNLTNSTISGNDAFFDGGGVGIKYLGGSARWTIDHSTISGNDTYLGNGGGVSVGYQCCGPFSSFPNSGSLDVLDSTISGNHANRYGGGVMVAHNAEKYADTVNIRNSTIASNDAYDGGGGVYQDYAANGTYFGASLFSTIVGDNTLTGGAPNDLEEGADFSGPGETPFELSFSLVEAPGNSLLSQNPAGSNLIGVDPQLGALAANGGLTKTHLPSINSPVVDQGSAPGDLTTDQRGDPRTVDTSPANAHDGTDIGSVELATGPPGPPPPPPPAAGGTAGTKIHNVKKKHKKRRRIIRTKHKFAKIHLTFGSTNPAVTNYKCSLDGAPAEPCASPFSARVRSAPSPGKNHVVVIQSYDANGNAVGKPRTFRFRVVLKD